MIYQAICISSGHSTKCQGAIGPSPWGLNEVEEATRVVDRVYEELKSRGVAVEKFHDTVSTTQDANLNRIIDWHNSKVRQLDISCHFNASTITDKPVGTEVWFVSQEDLASELSAAMAKSGLKDRGSKYTSSLFFLNNTAADAVLLEVAFVDSKADVELYRENFDHICADIADVLGGVETGIEPPLTLPPEPAMGPLFETVGACSYFGGPDDHGVSQSEGLAFHYSITENNQHLFLPIDNGTGLARRLNPSVHYVACRWNYSDTPKEMLANSGQVALVRNVITGVALTAYPADWGPHEDTKRVADLSPKLLADLDLQTDDEVEVIYPYTEQERP